MDARDQRTVRLDELVTHALRLARRARHPSVKEQISGAILQLLEVQERPRLSGLEPSTWERSLDQQIAVLAMTLDAIELALIEGGPDAAWRGAA